jgi:predicted transcriptional regulator
MPAVTLKLSDELKSRINELADASGKSPHAFMLDALASQITREENRRAFVQSALVAREEVARYGEVHEAADVHKWLLARVAGKKVAAPGKKKLAKK